MKIKAYTLMEVTIAMLLSAIAISICYTAYGIISSYYTAFYDKTQVANQIIAIRHVMETDFIKSKIILKIDDGMEVVGDSSSIYYVFNEHNILRTLITEHTDTFKVQAKELTGYFEANPILTKDTIDQLNFKLVVDKKIVILIQINKYYSAKELFN